MSAIGDLIRARREARGWSRGDLVEAAQRLPGCPDLTTDAIMDIERGRTTLRVAGPPDPMAWCIMALRLPEQAILRALRLAPVASVPHDSCSSAGSP